MGGKGGGEAPPPIPVQSPGIDMATLMPLLATMSQTTQQAPPTPPEPVAPPVVEEATPVDWETKEAELRREAKANTARNAEQQKGYNDTIHASLLDDDYGFSAELGK